MPQRNQVSGESTAAGEGSRIRVVDHHDGTFSLDHTENKSELIFERDDLDDIIGMLAVFRMNLEARGE